MVLRQIQGPVQKESETTGRRPVSSSSSSGSRISSADTKRIQAIVRGCLEAHDRYNNLKLIRLTSRISTDNAILKARIRGLEQALTHEKRKRKRGKALFENMRSNAGQGAMFFSLQKLA